MNTLPARVRRSTFMGDPADLWMAGADFETLMGMASLPSMSASVQTVQLGEAKWFTDHASRDRTGAEAHMNLVLFGRLAEHRVLADFAPRRSGLMSALISQGTCVLRGPASYHLL